MDRKLKSFLNALCSVNQRFMGEADLENMFATVKAIADNDKLTDVQAAQQINANYADKIKRECALYIYGYINSSKPKKA